MKIYRDEIEREMMSVLEALQARHEKLQDTYDDRSCNEPEYESAIERWEEALDRLQEQIDELEDINSRLDDFMSGYDDYDGDEMEVELKDLYDDYDGFNALYRGISPILKNYMKILKKINSYNRLNLLDIEE